jgi:hypothetical protein
MIKTNKPVTVAALLLVLCILPGATNINLGYPRKFKFVADRVSFEQSVAAPVAFVALSRGLDSELVRNSIKNTRHEAFKVFRCLALARGKFTFVPLRA